MRRVISLCEFWYGCLGTLCCACWYFLVLFGYSTLPSFDWLFAFFVLYCCAVTVTFQPRVRPAWQPLFAATPGRIKLAKILLGLAASNFVVCFGVLLVAGKDGNQALIDKTVSLMLMSFFLLNTIYIAIHWAFRPEKLFPGAVIEIITDPLGSFLRMILRGKK